MRAGPALLDVDLGREVRAGFTRRGGGVSRAPYDTLNLAEHVGDDPAAVRTNRQRLADAVAQPPARFTWMTQVHGARVSVVRAPRGQPCPDTDATVTACPGLVLAVLVADCVPVLLADPAAGVVAAVHAGRRGVQAGVVPAAVAAMCRLGAAPARLRAALGPAVCGRCYEVPAPMQREVLAVVPAAEATTRRGTPALDLPAAVRAQLQAAGVPACTDVGVCTVEEPGWFSHRRDGTTGRFAGLVWTTG